MKKIFFIAAIGLSCIMHAQQTFHPMVKIEFERVSYVRQQVKEAEPEWYEMIKDRIPDQAVSYYEFIGDTAKSIYRQTKEAVVPATMWYEGNGERNVVFNNYTTGRTISQKPVAEETFLVEDSFTHIKWKLTADTRTIAGYDCKKAIGFVDDTLAVFAFYTDEILVTGGPESIRGLPGMILGVGAPRLHVTWFATKVETNSVPLNSVVPATKGKKITRSGMMNVLDNVLKNWGKYGSAMRLNYLL